MQTARRIAVATTLLAFAATLLGCPQRVDEEYLSWAQRRPDLERINTLGPGDTFDIRVYQEPEMSNEYRVPQGGTIRFPLIGEIGVSGRSCEDIEAELNTRLADGFIRNPAVTCSVLELNSLGVVVGGEVNAPGVFPYAPELTVVEAIAMAEGLTQSAADDRLVVSRVVDDETFDIVVPFRQIVNGRAPNFRLWPNDSIFVPSFRLLP